MRRAFQSRRGSHAMRNRTVAHNHMFYVVGERQLFPFKRAMRVSRCFDAFDRAARNEGWRIPDCFAASGLSQRHVGTESSAVFGDMVSTAELRIGETDRQSMRC